MVDISKVLKDIISKSGMEQERFGETIGLKKAAFNNYVQGRRELPKSVISKMMEVHGINPAVFFDKNAPLYIRDISGANIKNLPTNLIPVQPNFVEIPILGNIACGDPITAIENHDGYRYEPEETLPSGNLFYLKAKGNSMEPTVPDGSYVLIREQPEIEYGQIAAVLVNGDTEITLKRIKKQGNAIFLMPDNPKHDPILVDENNPVRVIGKAVRYTQDL
ncbi:LexA family transcriptional regulator [Lysinibacillus fusiformis]|uniref:LexA family transcriptional regulator n=1 Tax=Lysinibacillus TaxID=400634 RepID=UPI0023312691|nr:LexA family transcriptional regulator [Lysinibacillus sp. OF-1]MEE3805684.1 LexA family transcriptional regulator [Lysinibacillus fusiformis]WCH46610.1 LexA family transcriptional regulator [Lysinibacillus sp. OF-1]